MVRAGEEGSSSSSACSDVITFTIDPGQAGNYTNGMTREKNHPFQMRVSAEWLETIDNWREGQRPIPSRAEAIRRLVDFAMAAEPLAELMALAPPNEDFRAWVNEIIGKAHLDQTVRR